MKFAEQYKQAKLLGYTLEQMKANCRDQLHQNAQVPSWRIMVPKCLQMIRWLDRISD